MFSAAAIGDIMGATPLDDRTPGSTMELRTDSKSEVLYYPFMEVRDHAWLLNAILFWERVLTIVPEREIPYQSSIMRPLSERGWLAPLRVDVATMARAVEKASGQTIGLLNRVWELRREGEVGPLRRSDMHISDTEWIGVDKGGGTLWSSLTTRGLVKPDDDPYRFHIDRSVFDLHMTLLATQLGDVTGHALVTDDDELTRLAEVLRARSADRTAARLQRRLARGPYGPDSPTADIRDYLARLSLQVIGVSETTPVDKVIRFREQHLAELDRFRSAVTRLSAGTTAAAGVGPNELHDAARELFLMEVRPAILELDKAMRLGRLESAQLAFSGAILGTTPNWLASTPAFMHASLEPLVIAALE